MATYTFDNVPPESELTSDDYLEADTDNGTLVWRFYPTIGWRVYRGAADDGSLRDDLALNTGATLIGTASGLTLQQVIDSLKWGSPITSSSTVQPNSKRQVYATVSAVDLTLTTFAVGDEFSVANSNQSTQTVRILNPSYTIIGSGGSAVAGENVIIETGNTATIRARTLSVLEVT